MASRYRWHQQISNSYLGVTKIIRGMTKAELNTKVNNQLAIWARQEAQRRAKLQAAHLRLAQQSQLQAMEAQAEAENAEAQARIGALQYLLKRQLHSGTHFQWFQLKQHAAYPPFQFTEQPPTYEQVARSLGVPAAQPFLEGLLSSKRQKREMLEEQARLQLNTLMAQFEARKNEAFRLYTQQRQAYERARDEYNISVDARQQRFEQGDREAVTWLLRHTLENLALPEDIGQDFDVAFDDNEGASVITMQLPTLEEVPRVTGYKFVKSRQAIEPVEMKQKDFEALYDTLINQIALLTLHRVFREVYTPKLQAVVFNGWVNGIDRKTGNDFTSCIISVRAEREAFRQYNLERVDPKECIRNLRGLVAGPLAQLAPVRPILELNRTDKRFVESREVLANLSSDQNLATMDWEDFEHLVRELFSKVFGGEGAEVRVTRASRDQGVDAIAFDPDPIRGGKFVIQAKRYNNVVPVSAVRDLYGTMINEGAVKGILVTTSYFGNDSRDFANGKPLTLIDGAQLMYMFQEHGYEVTIELQKGGGA